MKNNKMILKELVTAQEAGETVVLATVTSAKGSVPRHAGSKMLIYEDGRLSGTIGGGEMESRVIKEAKTALQDGQARKLPYKLIDPKKGDPGVCGGEVEVYIEPYFPLKTAFIVGCGHVGKAVADLAHWLGYQVVVTDDRVELVSQEQIPHADVYLPGSIASALAEYKITNQTYIIVVTRNVEIDQKLIPHLVETVAPFIGVMGSKRRWKKTKELLKKDGLSEAQIDRCHSPIGLEIKAESPEEIAVSIMADIILKAQTSKPIEETFVFAPPLA